MRIIGPMFIYLFIFIFFWTSGELSKKTAPDGTDRQTHKHTDGHGDSMTDPAQRAESVKKKELVPEDCTAFSLNTGQGRHGLYLL